MYIYASDVYQSIYVQCANDRISIFFEETTESAVEKKIKDPFPNLYFLCFAFFSFIVFPFSSRYKKTHIALFIVSVHLGTTARN